MTQHAVFSLRLGKFLCLQRADVWTAVLNLALSLQLCAACSVLASVKAMRPVCIFGQVSVYTIAPSIA